MFGELKEVTQISKVSFARDRENCIRDCFVNENKSKSDFDQHTKTVFKKNTKDIILEGDGG